LDERYAGVVIFNLIVKIEERAEKLSTDRHNCNKVCEHKK